MENIILYISSARRFFTTFSFTLRVFIHGKHATLGGPEIFQEGAGHLYPGWSEHRLPEPAFRNIPGLAGIISAPPQSRPAGTNSISFRYGAGFWLHRLVDPGTLVEASKGCFRCSWMMFSWFVSILGSASPGSLSLLPNGSADGSERVTGPLL